MSPTSVSTPSAAKDYVDPAMNRPFYRLLGLRSEPGQPQGRSRVVFDPQPDFENSRGDVHGGVIASLLDASMGVACRSAYKEGEGATTVSLTVNYLAPGRGRLTGLGNTVRNGRSLACLEATVVDETGQVIAQAIATMRVIARRTSG